MFYTILKGIVTIVLVFLAIIGLGTIYYIAAVAANNEMDNKNEE